MNYKSAYTNEAAAIILLNYNNRKVLWTKRNPKLKFLGGFHGFPGGKVDKTDTLAEVRNCPDAEMARSIVEEIYPDLNPTLGPLARKTVEAHLEKLSSEGKVDSKI